ncbi:T9SS type A sorting domain-containing protein [bacterium]|nr:T9SS type A sorting domain-containing protein [bacterium]
MKRMTIVGAFVLFSLLLMGTNALATWQYANSFNLVPPETGAPYGEFIPGWYTTDYSVITSLGVPRTSKYLRYIDPTDDFNPLDSDAAFMRFDLLSTASDNYWKGIKVTLHGNEDFDPNYDLLPITRERAVIRFPDSVYVGGPDMNTFMGLQIYEEQGMAAGSDINAFDHIDLINHPEHFRDTLILCNPATLPMIVCDTLISDECWHLDSTDANGWTWWHAYKYFESNLMDRASWRETTYGLPFLRYWMVLRAEGCHSLDQEGGEFAGDQRYCPYAVPCNDMGYVVEGISNEDTFFVSIAEAEDIIVYKINTDEIRRVDMDLSGAYTDVYEYRDFDWPDPTVPGWLPDHADWGRWARSEEIWGWDQIKPQIRTLYPANVVLSNGYHTDCIDDEDDYIFSADSTQPISFIVRDVGTCVESVAVKIEYINDNYYGTNFPEYNNHEETWIFFRNPLSLDPDDENGSISMGWQWRVRFWDPPNNWTDPTLSGFGTWSEMMVYPLNCHFPARCCTDSFVIENGENYDDILDCFIDGAHVKVTIYSFSRTSHWHYSPGWNADTTWEFRVDLSGPNADMICPEANGHDNDTEEFSGSNRRSDIVEGYSEWWRWLADSLPLIEIEVYDDYDRVHDTANHGLYYSGHYHETSTIDCGAGAGINKRDFRVQFDVYVCQCTEDPDYMLDRTMFVDENDLGWGVYIDEIPNGESGTMWINFEELAMYDPDFGSAWTLESGAVMYVIMTKLFDDPDYGQSDDLFFGDLPLGADIYPSGSYCFGGRYDADPNYGCDDDEDNHTPLESPPTSCPGYSEYSADTLGIIRIDLVGPVAPDTFYYPPRQWITSDTFQVITVDIYDQIGCPDVDSNFSTLYDCVAGVYSGTDPDNRLVMNIKVQGCDGTWHPEYVDHPTRPWEGRDFIWGGPGDDWLYLEKIHDMWGLRVTFDPYRRSAGAMHFRAGDKVCVTVYVWDNAYNDCHPDDFELECEDSTWAVDVYVPGRNHAIDKRDPDYLYPIQRQVARWSFFVDVHAPIVINDDPGGPCCEPWTYDLRDISDRVGEWWCDEWVAGIYAVDVKLTFLDSAHGGNPNNMVKDVVCFPNVTFYSWTPGHHTDPDRDQWRYATLIYGGEYGGDPTREARLIISCIDSSMDECHFFQPTDVVICSIWAGDNVNVPWYPATVAGFGYPHAWYHEYDSYSHLPVCNWRYLNHDYYIGADDSLLHWDGDCYTYFTHVYNDFVNWNWALAYVGETVVQGETYIQSVDWFNDEAFDHWGRSMPFGWPQDLHGKYLDIHAREYEQPISTIDYRDEFIQKFTRDLNFMWVGVVTCVDSIVLECVEDTFYDTLTGRAPYIHIANWNADGDLVWEFEDYYNCHCDPCFLDYYPDRYRCWDYGWFRIGPLDQLAQWMYTIRDTVDNLCDIQLGQAQWVDTTYDPIYGRLFNYGIIVDTLSDMPLEVDTNYIVAGWMHRDSVVVTLGVHVRTPNQFGTDEATYLEFRWDYILDMMPPTAYFSTLEGTYGYEEVNCYDRHAWNNQLRVRLEDIRDADVGCSANYDVPAWWSTVWPNPAVKVGSDWLINELGTWANQPLFLNYNPGTYYLYTQEYLYIANCAPEIMPGRHHAVGPVTLYSGLEYTPSGTTAVLNTYTEDTIFIADTLHAEAIIQDKLGNEAPVQSPQIILDNGLPEVKGMAFATYDDEGDRFTNWDPEYCWVPWSDPGRPNQDSLVAIYNFGDLCTIYVRIWFDDNMDMREADPSYGYIVRFRPEGWTHWFPVIPMPTHAGFYPLSNYYINYNYGIMAPRGVPGEDEFTDIGRETEAMFLDNGWNSDREWIGYMIIAGDGIMDGLATLRVSGFDDNAANIMLTRDFPFRIETEYWYPEICFPATDSFDLEHTDPWATDPYDDDLVLTGRSGTLCDWPCDTVDGRTFDLTAYNYDVAITDSIVWYIYWDAEMMDSLPDAAAAEAHYVIDNPREACQVFPAEVYDVVHAYPEAAMYMTVEFRAYSRFYVEDFVSETLWNVLVDNESPCTHVNFDNTVAGGMIPPGGMGVTIIPYATSNVRIVLTGTGVPDVDYVLYFYQDILTGEHYPIIPETAHEDEGCGYVAVGASPDNPYYDPINEAIIYDWDWMHGYGLTPGIYRIKARGYDLINIQYGECSYDDECMLTSYETFYHPFTVIMDTILVPYEVLFARGDNFCDATMSTFGDIYCWDAAYCLPDWPGWVNEELDGIVDEFPYLDKFPITTFTNPDYTSGPPDPLMHPFVENGGYPGDSLYVMFMDVGADSIDMIIEDEFGGHISGSNLRIFRRMYPEDMWMNPCDEMYYYVYNWIVDDQDNRYDGPVKVTIVLYFWNEFYSEVTITEHVSYILLDTYDPYYVTALTRMGTGEPLLFCHNEDYPGEKIWVTNAGEIEVGVYWHETVFDQADFSPGFIDYDPTGRNWRHLRMTIDGQPHSGFHTDDPNDHLEARLWHSLVIDEFLDPIADWVRDYDEYYDDCDWFNNNFYGYRWYVADDVRGNGFTKLLIKGRDVAGNILDYDEAELSISEGKFALIDVTVPECVNTDLVYATEVSFAADPGAFDDNFIDAGYYDPVGGTYVYIDLYVDDAYVMTVWVNPDGSVTPVVASFTDGDIVHMMVYDLAGNYAECEVEVAPHYTCCDFELCPGWNFISVPRTLEDATIDANFPAEVDIYIMDAAGEFIGPMDRSTELEVNKGYVAYAPDYISFSICGRCVEEWSYELVTGWNLIGSLCDPVPFVMPDTDPAGIIEPDNTFWYDACTDAYYQVEELTPCMAHLVLAAGEGTLYVPARTRIVHTVWKPTPINPLWTVSLSFDSKELDKELIIGLGEGASDRYDRGTDEASLPTIPGRPDVYLDNAMVKNINAPDNVVIWDVNVKGEFTLSVNPDLIPEGYSILVHTGEKQVNLAEETVTLSDGVYKVGAIRTIIPEAYALDQNRPNPFNATTVINYAVPEEAHVRLEVYNVLGNKLVTLVDDVETAGFKSVMWDGKDADHNDVGTGVYFYKLRTDNYTSIKKMILMK